VTFLNHAMADDTKRMKAAALVYISKLAEEQAANGGIPLSKNACATLGNFFAEFIKLYATDLAHFVKHRERVTITTVDVMLFARKNPVLSSRLAEIENEREEKPTTTKKKKKKKDSAQ